MIGFWTLFIIPAFRSVIEARTRKSSGLLPWVLVGIVFSLAIGFRFEVGGDWFNYLNHYERYYWFDLLEVVTASDPGYVFINWLAVKWGWGVYGVNLMCGALFMLGLLILCRQQPRPWLAFAVAVPYVLVVVAMGYTRQSVALGFLFWAIASLERGAFLRYLLLVAVAALFHKTALVMIPLGLFLNRKGKIFRAVAVLVLGYALWDLLLAASQAGLWKNYVEAQMESSGAQIRVAMNLVPALLFLLYRKRWRELYGNSAFWLILSLGAVVSVFLVGFASTAVDRISLYFTPLQIVVLARLPELMEKHFSQQTVAITVLLVYGLVLYVWLNFATHAQYWLPYRNWLLM